MKNLSPLSTLMLFVLLCAPSLALAKPDVVISMKAEKETVVIEDDKEVIKIVPATEITPGETIIYTLTYTNSGDEAATNVVVDNPVPQGTIYLPNTVTTAGAEATFSIDGGKTFKQPALLTYRVKKTDGTTDERAATPEDYTHIRWNITTIAPAQSGELSYRAKVK